MSIVFVIGPACAGKSTYIKNNLQDFEKIDLLDFQNKYPVLGYDEVIQSYDDCKIALVDAVKSNKDVVLEHTLLRAIRREIYIDAIKELGDYDIECVVIKPDIDTLIKRKKERTQFYNPAQCKEELDILEIPTKEEGFSKITIIEDKQQNLDKENSFDER